MRKSISLISCININKIKSRLWGIYILFDNNGIIYYVGASRDLATRLKTYCTAKIGSSEGVVRFLMYLLPDICRKENLNEKDILTREFYIKSYIISFIKKLNILIIVCDVERNWSRLLRVEQCIRMSANPLLNPM